MKRPIFDPSCMIIVEPVPITVFHFQGEQSRSHPISAPKGMKLEREEQAKARLSSISVFPNNYQFGCPFLPQTQLFNPKLFIIFIFLQTYSLLNFHISVKFPSHPNLEFCNHFWLFSFQNSTHIHLPRHVHSSSNVSFPFQFQGPYPGLVSDYSTSGVMECSLISQTKVVIPLNPPISHNQLNTSKIFFIATFSCSKV